MAKLQYTAGQSLDALGAEPNVLSYDELARFHRDGFVVPEFRFSSTEIARLQALTLQLAADKPTSSDIVVNCPHAGRKGDSRWMEFAAHPAVLDMIEQIMGPDIILRGAVAFYKRAGDGPATPWHRDAVQVPIAPLASTNIWFAVTGSYIDNSCMRFIPGSHKGKVRGRHSLSQDRVTLDPSEFDESAAVDVELEAGRMVIFDLFTIHGSRPNSSTSARASFSPRYMPATSRFDHDVKRPPELRSNGYIEPSDRPLILVRGRDQAGNDFQRGHPAPSGA